MEAWYYDDHGRVVYHVKGYPSGRRVRERSGYDFVGDLTALGRTMYDGAGLEEHTEAYAYQYDNWGRLLSTTHALDGGTPTTLASNTYDSVGRLSGTTRGAIGATPGPASLSSSYAYNVRDWLTEINSPLFSETLTYETPRNGSTLPGQWGGNLSGIQWGSGDSRPYRYDYTYDLLGRLREAAYGGGGNPNLKHGRKYDYDLNGNMTLRRSEELENLHWGAWLDWTWNTDDGNRPEYWHQQRLILNHSFPGESGLTEVQDEAYTYDPVGNRTGTRNMVGDTLNVMRYNLLNLPEEYVTTAGDTVKYVYSSDGEKLYVAENPSGSTARGTEYAANYRIENGTVTMIHTDAGYYTPVTSQGGSGISYSHIWYLKDHLGNNRVLADGSGSALKTHHYDPYGMEINVASTPVFPSTFPSGSAESPYLYGGKEWNETTSTYDFEARYLSPSFHRFTTMDPLAEKYYSISPYAYCANNPVNLVDPNGEIWLTPQLAESLKQETQNRIDDLNTQIGLYSEQMKEFGAESKEYQNLQLLFHDAQTEVALLNQALLDIDRLGDDTEYFYTLMTDKFFFGEEHHVQQYKGGRIGIESSSNAFALHEIRHVVQSLDAGGLIFENGLLRNAAGNNPYDKTRYKTPEEFYNVFSNNEIEAYQVQFSMDHSFPGHGVQFVSDINVHTVGTIHYPNGTPVYKHINTYRMPYY